MAIKVINEAAPPPGTLKRPELYALAIGQVIGAGVITLIVPAIKMTGYSAWLAYAAAIIFGFLIIAPAVFVTSGLRLGGGYYSIITNLIGPKFGGIFAFAFLTQSIGLSLFGVAASEYLGDAIPFLGSSLAKMIVGVVLLTFFYIVNLAGVDIMAGAQKLMTWLLIASLVMFIIFGVTKIQLPIFEVSRPDFFAKGFIQFSNGMLTGGFAGAVLLFVYSCQGYVMTMAYGRDAANAKKDIPWAILISVPTLLIIYVGVAIAASGSLRIEDYGQSTSLVFVAKKILPGPLFYVFIIGGPIMALLTTLNSTFAFQSLTIGRSCKDGWLPKSFGAKNKKGAYKNILTYIYIIGMIPILLRFNITTITNQIQLLASSIGIMYIFAYFRYPRKYPQAWKKARYHIPNPVYYALTTISILFNLIVFWKSCLSINLTIVIISLAAISICVILGLWRSKNGDIMIYTSVWPEDNEGTA
ncbi:MAG: APC family permease [Treponema sp.]|nr:APC family permease [Treponema sp.]